MMRAPDPAALAAVEAAAERFEAERERGRLRLYRLRLQATVVAVSPLTRDLANQQGSDLDEVADLLRPRPELPERRAPAHRFRHRLASYHKGSHPPPQTLTRASDLRISRRIARDGVVLPRLEDREERVGFVPDGGTLESAGWLGRCWVCTAGPLAHILLGGDVPDTIIAAAAGRTIDEIVGHPVLAGRDYTVRRALALPGGTGVVLSFEAGVIAHRMPWADLLRVEMGRAS